jgi:hypothetical protein
MTWSCWVSLKLAYCIFYLERLKNLFIYAESWLPTLPTLLICKSKFKLKIKWKDCYNFSCQNTWRCAPATIRTSYADFAGNILLPNEVYPHTRVKIIQLLNGAPNTNAGKRFSYLYFYWAWSCPTLEGAAKPNCLLQ